MAYNFQTTNATASQNIRTRTVGAIVLAAFMIVAQSTQVAAASSDEISLSPDTTESIPNVTETEGTESTVDDSPPETTSTSALNPPTTSADQQPDSTLENIEETAQEPADCAAAVAAAIAEIDVTEPTQIEEVIAETACENADEHEHEDDLSDELKAEDKSDDIEVPERDGLYKGQNKFTPPGILWNSIEEAEAKLSNAQTEHDEAVEQVRRLRTRVKELDQEKAKFDAATQHSVTELESASARLSARAVETFKYHMIGSVVPEVSAISTERTFEEMRRTTLTDTLLSTEQVQTADLAARRKLISDEALEVFDRVASNVVWLQEAEALVGELAGARDQAQIELSAFQIGSQIFVEGAVFPIGGQYKVPLIDSYGFPRMPGTADEHWHEGIDIFAPKGAPLVATERGVINNIGTGRLGGLKFWLKGESGAEWYYAHLDSFAPGLAEGQLVEAGDLVGYVGNTGNAITTPPHLHMELHPNGDAPVNPYPLLRVLSDLDLAAFASGEMTEFDHEPFVAGSGPNPVTFQVPVEEIAAQPTE